MLNARLDELRRDPNAPFLFAASSSGRLRAIGRRRSARPRASKEDAVERGFAALLEEVLRVERHGFTATELERAKSDVLRQFQQAVQERDKTRRRELRGGDRPQLPRGRGDAGPRGRARARREVLARLHARRAERLWPRRSAQGSRVITVTGPATHQQADRRRRCSRSRSERRSRKTSRPTTTPVTSAPLMKGRRSRAGREDTHDPRDRRHRVDAQERRSRRRQADRLRATTRSGWRRSRRAASRS